MGLLAILAAVCLAAPDPDPSLLEMLKIARRENAARLTRGRLEGRFLIESDVPNKGTIKSEVKVDWDEADIFLLIKISDPSHIRFRDAGYSAPIDVAEETLGLIVKNDNYFFNKGTNTLHVYRNPRRDAFGSHQMFEAAPSTSWNRCCPPWTPQGSTWDELMTTRSPFHRDGSSVDVRLDPKSRLVTYVRRDPGVGTLTYVCSLEFQGNVIEHEFLPDPESVVPNRRKGRLDWRRLGTGGPVVLSRRIYEDYSATEPDKLRFRSTMEVKSLTLLSSRPSTLSLDFLKTQVPRSARVDDHFRKTQYPLFRAETKREDFRGAAETVRSGNLFKGDPR